jgi:integrase
MTRRTRGKRRPRGLYHRQGRGWYADFRRFADVGGRLEALIPRGSNRATDDADLAASLYAVRLTELERARRDGALHGRRRRRQLADYVAYHLEQKAKMGRVEARWIACAETFLRRAVAHFGAGHYLDNLGVAEVQAWLVALAEGRHTEGRQLSAGSVRHHLNALSNLYRRAAAEEVVSPGYNPASAILEKPTGAGRGESAYLEVHDAALLLEAARLPGKRVNGHAMRDAFPLVATLLLTGGRLREVLGLEVEDVSFDRRVVTFRPNAWRRLKTRKSARTVPLWPQLEEILRPYVFDLERPPGQLLFPSFASGREALRTDTRKLLDHVAGRAGWKAGEIRAKMFRHTYCAARLQTLDHGAAVSSYTVARELGHGSTVMVEKVYSHLGTLRHPSDVVEYRIEQHAATLGDRLAALRGFDLLPKTLPGPTAGLEARGEQGIKAVGSDNVE